jgi:hypothetical protein
LSGEDGTYQVAGERMVIYLQEHRSVLEGSRIVIPGAAVVEHAEERQGGVAGDAQTE